MRALVQRVTKASVSIDGETISEIGTGMCALVGVTHNDTVGSAHKLASKLWGLRIFDDGSGRMNLSVGELDAEVLVISQFTLYGSTDRGRRPSWVAAAPREHAEPLIDAVSEELGRLGAAVATGRFGGDMAVSLTNDGPVTLLIDVD